MAEPGSGMGVGELAPSSVHPFAAIRPSEPEHRGRGFRARNPFNISCPLLSFQRLNHSHQRSRVTERCP